MAIPKALLRDCDIEVLGPQDDGNCLVRLTHRPSGQTGAAYGRRRSAQAVALAEIRKKTRLRHECDETCVCPVHGTPLIYHPAGDDHACQDVTCEHGHGGLNPVLAAFDRIGMGWLKPFAVDQGFEDAAAVAQLAQDQEPTR